MEGFIFEINGYEVLKVQSNSVFLLLILTGGIDILFEKLTPRIGG